MVKARKRKINKVAVALLTLIAIILAACILIVCMMSEKAQKEYASRFNHVINSGYYPLTEAMKADGYTADTDTAFSKTSGEKEIVVSFDLEGGVCLKNQYEFSVQDKILQYDSDYFIQKDALESILNCTLTFENGAIQASPLSYEQHGWTQLPALIAHAGGGVRETDHNMFYTNSMEALVQNYNLGHRVFEFDFYLTSDNKLASVHDWIQFGNMDGIAMSSEEWKNFKTSGSYITDGQYTTLMVEDILDEMLVNKDMVIVTDTKSTEVSEEETRLQFQLIYDAAMQRDPDLINRVIPQIYNNEMYDIVMSVYDFPSIIYTAYATPLSGEEIVDFSSSHENIKVITAPTGDSRFTDEVIKTIHNNEMLIYNHTLNAYTDITDGKAKGIDGFYTDLLLPADMLAYEYTEAQ